MQRTHQIFASTHLALVVSLILLIAAAAAAATAGCARPGASPETEKGPDTVAFRSIHMTDTAAGWGLTARAIKRTEDGGATWKDVTPAGLQAPKGMSAFYRDALHARLLVPVKASGSAGASGAAGAASAAGAAGATGVAAAPESIIYRTTNGGSSWQGTFVPFQGDFLFALSSGVPAPPGMPDNGGKEWVLTPAGVYFSGNGGVTWEPPAGTAAGPGGGGLPAGDTVKGLFFRPDGAAGWVTTAEEKPGVSAMYQSVDRGRTWKRQDLPWPRGMEGYAMEISTASFASPMEGLALALLRGRRPSLVIYRTTDGGEAWTPSAPLRLDAGAAAATIIDGRSVALADGSRKIRFTSDAGATWKSLSLNLKLTSIDALSFVGSSAGWVLGRSSDGTQGLYRSLDGGRTWSSAFAPESKKD